VAARLLNGTLNSAKDELVAAFKEAFLKVPISERMLDSVLKQLYLMGDFYAVLVGGVKASSQRKAMRSTAESLKYIATKQDAAFSLDEHGEATEASTKTKSKGHESSKPVKKGKTKKAIQKPSAEPKVPRAAGRSRKKGGGKKS